MTMEIKLKRCGWVTTDPLYQYYHDQEWGIPVRDSRQLFEMLCLEGAQAGLSWITILKKRENYRKVFEGFDPDKIASYDEKKIEELMQDEGIVRHLGKIRAFIANANAYLKLEQDGIDFSQFLWAFVGGSPVRNNRLSTNDIPTSTPESEAMSKGLKKLGFKFVGSTTCYAFMQAAGMVDDHEMSCFKREMFTNE